MHILLNLFKVLNCEKLNFLLKMFPPDEILLFVCKLLNLSYYIMYLKKIRNSVRYLMRNNRSHSENLIASNVERTNQKKQWKLKHDLETLYRYIIVPHKINCARSLNLTACEASVKDKTRQQETTKLV